MTLISSIIADAYRESNLIALGREPTAGQVTEGLRLLNALFSAVLGDEAGEGLRDWPLGNYGREIADTALTEYQRAHPPINHRLIAVNDEAITVYLTPAPQDGSRMSILDPFGRLATYPVVLDANGRTIDGTATKTLDTNGLEISGDALSELLSVDVEGWKSEIPSIKEHLDKFGSNLPAALRDELDALEKRLNQAWA